VLERRLTFELVAFTALATATLLLVLGAGQLAKLADLVGGGADWVGLLAPTGVILLEAALPLAGLVAAGLVYGRLRADGALVARAALGQGPVRVWAPPALVGLALGACAAWLAHAPVPEAVTALRGRLLHAAVTGVVVDAGAVGLPGGGVVRTDPGLWAALPNGDEAPTLLHARSARVEATDSGLALELRGVHLWGADLRVQTAEAEVRLDDPSLFRRLGMLGPPNATTSAGLGDGPHQRFTWHRRLSLPALAPLWALLGALLGAALGGPRATAVAAAAVAAAYWLLRTGELSARAGLLDPAFAAWAPFATLLCVLALALPRLATPGSV